MKHGRPNHSTDYLREACGDSYFQWLSDDVSMHGPHEYWRLLRALHRKEFYYSRLCGRDGQLSEDGLYLRYMYKHNYRDYEDNNPMLPSCLEVLLSLAMKLEAALYLGDKTYQDWFWLFLHNLTLDRFTDDDYDTYGGTDMVNYILSQWLTRGYRHDGKNYNIFRTKSQDIRTLDILSQGYLWIQEHYGEGHLFDDITNQPIG